MRIPDRPRCSTCKWWEVGKPPRASWETLPGTPEMFLGACTVVPPTIVGVNPEHARTMFPQTHMSRSCGWWTEDDGDEDGGDETADVVPIGERQAA